jgi:hypothetical protein
MLLCMGGQPLPAVPQLAAFCGLGTWDVLPKEE